VWRSGRTLVNAVLTQVEATENNTTALTALSQRVTKLERTVNSHANQQEDRVDQLAGALVDANVKVPSRVRRVRK
jgi:hypothetical protein